MITSTQNKQVKNWRKLHSKKFREKEGLFLIEGWHLIEEALRSDWTVVELICTEDLELPPTWKHMKTYQVTNQVLNHIAQTESPQGMIAVVKQRNSTVENTNKLLLLDRVQDPGNVGTIIRSALAFDFDGVILGEGSADLFNEKVIRSTQGAIFHLPIIRANAEELVTRLKSENYSVYATALDEEATPVQTCKPSKPYVLIVGNEGEGVGDTLLELADDNIYIPISNQSESLNVAVATSIALYQFSNDT
ncbi:TrmH family RNA methyltransferase [Halalkalibacillus halophilus]|uniref:TrmH family RNA methyltransferase n=1 Tax=Halalkalibacillus halophilus TaxID=392827 RepID=UPI0004002267|nr:RNA methyltransferase [Halalkalibacillus halophilus]